MNNPSTNESVSANSTSRKENVLMFDKKLDLRKITHAMNGLIDKSIFVRKISIVSDEFHARYSVYNKEYIYKINIGEYDPINKDYIYQYNKKISKELLDNFCSIMSGVHNYKSFTSDKDNSNYERDVKISYKIQNKIIYLRFESSGFLRYMIRNIVGLLLDINDGKKSLDDISSIFDSMDRTSLGRCANPEGLYLNNINFM